MTNPLSEETRQTMTENAMKPPFDITRFCAKYDIRSHLKQPIVSGGFVYATNGHICVRVPAAATDIDTRLYDERIAKLVASMQKMFAEQQDQRTAALPDLSAVKPCARCKGKGEYMAVQCGNCDGDGDFTRDGHDYTCKSCVGEGHLESDGENNAALDQCADCYGIGFPLQTTPVGDSFFAAGYLKWLEHLPGLQAHTQGPEKVGMFTFDGGVALLMPRRQ